MMEKCSIALEAEGFKHVTSKVTILEDLKRIENSFPEAIIVQRKIGRKIYYEYEDKSFSIYNIPLNDDEMAQLAQTISILSKFEGMPNFDWIDDFIERFKSTLNIPSTKETIVAFDENFDLKGRNWFAKLFSAIASQQALKISYQPFDKSEKTYLFHPYLLKQYNNRWFLFGCIDGYTSPTNFPLDRIKKIERATIAYQPNTDIDFNEYFEDMIGVSRRSNEATKIQIKVDNWRFHYIDTKPLHGTQRVIRHDDDGVVIQIEVIINPELLQLLLSYGSSITVLEPQELQRTILEESEKISQKYQSVHIN
jgi:predicted DNA-binding transcriptional regulator YafY